MKKTLAVLSCLLLFAGLFAGCGKPAADSGKLRIVVTIFPEYDWVMQILGDRADQAEVTMLLDNGVDLHSYRPTADDMIRIADCDLFIYVGGESDKWVNDILRGLTNPDIVTIDLLEVLGDAAKEEEIKEGMQTDGAGEEEDEEAEYDEHVWLSLRNAAKICKCIAEKLGGIDPENKDHYSANADSYIEKLNALDRKYKAVVENAHTKVLLFGDRFPFRYLTEDYGLDYYAAFVGCSAESEASFETILFLAGKVDALGLKAICTIERSDGKIAKTVRDATKTKDQVILALDSMQSTTAADIQSGASYLSIMEKNLEVLKDALK